MKMCIYPKFWFSNCSEPHLLVQDTADGDITKRGKVDRHDTEASIRFREH
jgi:hypothetical protein